MNKTEVLGIRLVLEAIEDGSTSALILEADVVANPSLYYSVLEQLNITEAQSKKLLEAFTTCKREVEEILK